MIEKYRPVLILHDLIAPLALIFPSSCEDMQVVTSDQFLQEHSNMSQTVPILLLILKHIPCSVTDILTDSADC